MLFGTHKNLSLQESTLDISCSMHKIQLKTKYKYLGVELDPSLSLGLHFESTYKKATGRLRLLSKIRGYVNNHTAKTSYESMIVPLSTYSGLVNLNLTQTNRNKLSRFHDRAVNLINTGNGQDLTVSVSSVESLNKRRACIFVRKCLDGFVPNNFISYFKVNSHGMGTRNASCLILLPKIHTEYARNSFYYMGAKTYNDLPTDVRKVSNFNSFVNMVKDSFN